MRRNEPLPESYIHRVRLLYDVYAGDGPYRDSSLLYSGGEIVECYAEESGELVIRDEIWYLPLDWDDYEWLR